MDPLRCGAGEAGASTLLQCCANIRANVICGQRQVPKGLAGTASPGGLFLRSFSPGGRTRISRSRRGVELAL